MQIGCLKILNPTPNQGLQKNINIYLSFSIPPQQSEVKIKISKRDHTWFSLDSSEWLP